MFWNTTKKSGPFVLQKHVSVKNGALVSTVTATVKSMWSSNGSALYRVLLKTSDTACYEIAISYKEEGINKIWDWININLVLKKSGVAKEHQPHFFLSFLNARMDSKSESDLSDVSENDQDWQKCFESYSKGFLAF